MKISANQQCCNKATSEMITLNTYHLCQLICSLCHSLSVITVHYKDEPLEGGKNSSEVVRY